MLKTSNLEYTYDNQNSLRFPDFECQTGESWLLLGNSGSGKTTLLHLLGGLRTPQKGDVTIANTALKSLSGTALDRFRGQNIGIIFQQSHFVRALTALPSASVRSLSTATYCRPMVAQGRPASLVGF